VAAVEWSAAIHKAAIAALLGVGLPELPEMHPQPLPQASTALPADARLDLVARRADVEASRLRVEAALRDVDVARAAFYPDLSLSALIGLQSIELDKFFLSSNRVPAIGPALHLPIFEGGRLRARFGASEAALQTAIADYNQTVIDAARAAAGEALLLLQVQARRKQHDAQLAAVERLRESAGARARQGLADARPELAATVEIDRARDADMQLASAALSAEIALTKALGGGYRTDADAEAPAETNTNNPPAGASLQ
jgi:multidrug efflux system outer membrane protein